MCFGGAPWRCRKPVKSGRAAAAPYHQTLPWPAQRLPHVRHKVGCWIDTKHPGHKCRNKKFRFEQIIGGCNALDGLMSPTEGKTCSATTACAGRHSWQCISPLLRWPVVYRSRPQNRSLCAAGRSAGRACPRDSPAPFRPLARCHPPCCPLQQRLFCVPSSRRSAAKAAEGVSADCGMLWLRTPRGTHAVGGRRWQRYSLPGAAP